MVENLFLESVALIRSLIRLFNLNFIFYFRISGVEPVQRFVLTDKRDVISKNVEFKKIKIAFLGNFVFKTKVTKFFFYFIDFIKRIFHVFQRLLVVRSIFRQRDKIHNYA
jgi:hypothetical protein